MDGQGVPEIVARMRRTGVVDLDVDLAHAAADAGFRHNLAFADAVILATARRFDAELITSDADLGEIEGVTYLPKTS